MSRRWLRGALLCAALMATGCATDEGARSHAPGTGGAGAAGFEPAVDHGVFVPPPPEAQPEEEPKTSREQEPGTGPWPGPGPGPQ
jgi:hypothetical protein